MSQGAVALHRQLFLHGKSSHWEPWPLFSLLADAPPSSRGVLVSCCVLYCLCLLLWGEGGRSNIARSWATPFPLTSLFFNIHHPSEIPACPSYRWTSLSSHTYSMQQGKAFECWWLDVAFFHTMSSEMPVTWGTLCLVMALYWFTTLQATTDRQASPPLKQKQANRQGRTETPGKSVDQAHTVKERPPRSI